jgi:hypothetical protein
MNEKTKSILTGDTIAETEKFLGKRWNEFSDEENSFMMFRAILDNDKKRDHLASIGDTFFNMEWQTFKDLLTRKGFIEGYSYHFLGGEYNEEYIVWYNLDKGWVISAESYGEKSVNGGKLYAEIRANSKDDWNDIFMWMSSGGLLDESAGTFSTSHDVREGLFSKLDELGKHGQFLSAWTEKNKFLWFLDYSETRIENHDYKKISQSKIDKFPAELRKLIGR